MQLRSLGPGERKGWRLNEHLSKGKRKVEPRGSSEADHCMRLRIDLCSARGTMPTDHLRLSSPPGATLAVMSLSNTR
ncbi:hypothetical protein R1flu_007914 [Riccia fluitans]|uniref:Uncharacterized protein n=1 Tax=Riccia fluitans TaxID=41844 RepID=A0ABD1Z0H2_9MARC